MRETVECRLRGALHVNAWGCTTSIDPGGSCCQSAFGRGGCRGAPAPGLPARDCCPPACRSVDSADLLGCSLRPARRRIGPDAALDLVDAALPPTWRCRWKCKSMLEMMASRWSPPARSAPGGCRHGARLANSTVPLVIGSTHQLFSDQLTLVGQEGRVGDGGSRRVASSCGIEQRYRSAALADPSP